ncbi:receptor homology region, transmembrane domain- and RING domain-containing protein 2-like [Telopea speciosissima]|uniref:receptor homology region, transmembrane domain- and RING domain-containing protein 2-like n=1 Tax=Telopea speciosissima TaxID=54955 RepID=UPI001CC74B0D|nr:receptor homology region, transmembrane domain- and RING domain-containing protein 2-like [Telopea speciosissima]
MTCMAMGSIRTGQYVGRLVCYLPLLYVILCLMVPTVTANVVLIGDNIIRSFDDIEANFAPTVKGSGESGTLYMAEPLDACSPLTNKIDTGRGANASFALIIRSGCTFEDKVRFAQAAGFKAAIIYDNDNGALVAMAGSSAGIKIHAVFISKASGEALKMYAGLPNMELWIIPTFENSAWSIMVISFVSLLAMSIVLATCFFVRRRRVRRNQSQAPRLREFHGMSSRLVKAMPSLIFTSVLEDNCTSMTCAICLEDYSVGDKLRVLPCRHKFHAACVDSWLTTWRTFCPVCKRDARTSTGQFPASERTPLLSPAASSLGLSSAGSSFASSSSAIQIDPALSRSSSISRVRSLAGTPLPQSLRSYGNSPALCPSRSSVDLRNASSQRSRASHLASPHSMGYPSFSPLSSRYMSTYVPSPTNASPSYLGSSSRQPNMLHCSESAASFSPFASAQSLPGC